MPRQLPWKSGGGGSRTQTIKPSTRQQKTTKILDDIDDDDFFDRSALAGNSKGKGKSKAASDSDDSLPLPTLRSRRTEKSSPNPQAASSSPPPLAEDAPPNESMRKGVSKFDLRDDEWMMVEDEFLETAKLFTRHLHIAEYDRLKETIEAKKKEAEIARPVVVGAKRSVDGAMKERAKAQDSRQKKAIRDVFASLGDKSGDDMVDVAKSSTNSLIAKPQPTVSTAVDTDSDDLDAARPARPNRSAIKPAPVSKAPTTTPPVVRPTPSSFAKPALPTSTTAVKPRVRTARKTTFDMFDDEYTPPPPTKPQSATPREAPRSQSESTHSSPQTLRPANTVRPRRSMDLLDDQRASNDGAHSMSQEVAERIAKRKAERARESDAEKKKTATRLDDIPTFLF